MSVPSAAPTSVEHETTPSAPTSLSELELIAKLRLAFGSTLHMLEAARDNLVVMGERMDRLAKSSRDCRRALERRRNAEASKDDDGDVKMAEAAVDEGGGDSIVPVEEDE